eukprot:scaffold136537_cov20-Tisochrysis_lutea.AAC.2
MVRPDDMIEATSDNKLCQLFIVSGLDPEAAKFAPQVQKVSGSPPMLTPEQPPRCSPQAQKVRSPPGAVGELGLGPCWFASLPPGVALLEAFARAPFGKGSAYTP